MATDCGELVSEVAEEEPVVDPANVTIGQCGQDFPVEGAPGETRDVRVVVTNTNDFEAVLAVVLAADGQEIGRARSVSVNANSNKTVRVTITIPAEGTYSVRALKENVRRGTSPFEGTRSPSKTGNKHVRAGSSTGNNGQNPPVADGGVEVGRPAATQAGTSARAALARACGGCAERSRKLSATNRRLRNVFDLFGG